MRNLNIMMETVDMSIEKENVTFIFQVMKPIYVYNENKH